MMTLYGVGYSRSFRALWALEEAELTYQYVNVEFGSEAEPNGSLSDSFQKLNVQGKVPVLVDNALVLTESGAILNYLANKSVNAHLLPEDGSLQRAKYDEMSFFILAELEQALWSNAKHRFALPAEYRLTEMLNQVAPFEFNKAQNALLKLKGDNEYAISDSFTMVDVLLAHTLSWAERFEFNVEQPLLNYRDKVISRPAFKRAAAQLAD